MLLEKLVIAHIRFEPKGEGISRAGLLVNEREQSVGGGAVDDLESAGFTVRSQPSGPRFLADTLFVASRKL